MTKYIVGVLALLLAGAVGLALMYRGNAANAKRAEEAQKVIAENAAARSAALSDILTKERLAAQQINTISTDLEEDNTNAEDVPDLIVADLRADRLRLRNAWAACETARVSSAATAPGERHEDSGGREEAAGRIVRIGRDADNQLSACQATVRFYENFYKQPATP